MFFPVICGSVGSKSRLAEAAGAESCGSRRNEELHAAVARSTFSSNEVQMLKNCTWLWCDAHFQVKPL